MGRLCSEAEIRIVRLVTSRISRSEKARTLLCRYEPAAALAGALSITVTVHSDLFGMIHVCYALITTKSRSQRNDAMCH